MEQKLTAEEFSQQIAAQDSELMQALREVAERSEPEDIRTVDFGGDGSWSGWR